MNRPRSRRSSSNKPQPRPSPRPQTGPRPQRPPQPPRQHAPASGPEPKSSASLHWREALAPFLADRNYQPLDEKALARRLHVPPEDAAAFTAFLLEEGKAGRVMQVRHSLYVLTRRLGFCVGRLQMNERGFGFLVPIDPAEPDFYIAGEDTGTAFHGDLV